MKLVYLQNFDPI